jgi:hypothetical protein
MAAAVSDGMRELVMTVPPMRATAKEHVAQAVAALNKVCDVAALVKVKQAEDPATWVTNRFAYVCHARMLIPCIGIDEWFMSVTLHAT